MAADGEAAQPSSAVRDGPPTVLSFLSPKPRSSVATLGVPLPAATSSPGSLRYINLRSVGLRPSPRSQTSLLGSRREGKRMKATRACELCGEEAALRCESDSAYLCWACDACVHGANFLVARHARRLLCHSCGDADSDRRQVSGPGFPPLLVVCRSCGGSEQMEGCGGSSDSGLESSSCCSSSCVSSTGSGAAAGGGSGGAAISSVSGAGSFPARIRSSSNTGADCGKPCRVRRQEIPAAARRDLDGRAEALLRIWCLRMGLDEARATSAAMHAVGVGARRMAAVPFRVTAAAAVWSAAKLCCPGAGKGGRRDEALLRRLEACSGVPARMIVVTEARLSRAVRSCHVAEEKEEGWGECA